MDKEWQALELEDLMEEEEEVLPAAVAQVGEGQQISELCQEI